MRGAAKGAVVLRGLVLLTFAVVSAVALTSCVRFVQHSFSSDHTVDSKLGSVRLQNGSGNVKVRYEDGATATTVHRVVHHPRDRKPSGDTHRVEGDTLVLADCGDRCSVDYDVVVPSKEIHALGEVGSGDVRLEGLSGVDISAGSGNVTVRDITGAVRIDAGSGDVVARDVTGTFTSKVGSGDYDLETMTGAVTIRTGSGDVKGARMGADVKAEANSGNVSLELAGAHSVRAEAGSGDITVRAPSGPYRVDVATGSGDREVAVANDPSAQHEMWLHADSGNVRLQAA